MFDEIGDLLELHNGDRFKIRAYRIAASNLRDFPHEISQIIEQKASMPKIAGIGDALAKKIAEAVATGKMAKLEQLKKQTPEALTELLKIPGLGPKRVQVIYKKLHVKTLADLKKALAAKKIQTLEGFGAKTEDLIRSGLAHLEVAIERHLRADIAPFAEDLERFIKTIPGVKEVQVCGSFRRLKDTVGDLDIVVTAKRANRVMETFVTYDAITDVIAQGSTRANVIIKKILQVDVRVVAQKSFGAAVHYFSGSKEHVIALRERAIARNLKINEYGVFRGQNTIAGETEESVYHALKLDWIPPELREMRGEIAAAQKHTLPQLVELKDLRGDLHTHTSATDGKNTLGEMAQAAKERGLKYMANTDHSHHLAMTHGFNAKMLERRIDEIERLNQKLDDFTILKGIEVDILENGRLDLPDDILGRLDVVVASVHSHFNLSSDKQTTRLLKALDHPFITMIGHISGRVLGQRPACEFDFEKVMRHTKQRGCYVELDSAPDRLDITDTGCLMAKELGILVSINSDAHSIQRFAHLQCGINQARRGWLEKKDVLNTRPLSELKKLLKAPFRVRITCDEE